MKAVPGCELCGSAGGVLLWRDASWRVVRIEDAAFPAFYRVICERHVREFSQLAPEERERCMRLVVAIERVLIERLHPAKVNLASLGNVVPHVHWHVVARFEDDSHFPQPIWGTAQREVSPALLQRLRQALPALDAAVVSAMRTCEV